MAYHPLSQDSGGNAYDRRLEANRILKMLEDECVTDRDDLTGSEEKFLNDMMRDRCQSISTKQLFFLRDIKDKYLS